VSLLSHGNASCVVFIKGCTVIVNMIEHKSSTIVWTVWCDLSLCWLLLCKIEWWNVAAGVTEQLMSFLTHSRSSQSQGNKLYWYNRVTVAKKNTQKPLSVPSRSHSWTLITDRLTLIISETHNANIWASILFDIVDSELCHKFTQMLVDKKQVIAVFYLLFVWNVERSC